MWRIGLINSCPNIIIWLKLRLNNQKVISNCYKWFIRSWWWWWEITSSKMYYLTKTRLIISFYRQMSKCSRVYCWMLNRNKNKNRNKSKSMRKGIYHHEAWTIEQNPPLQYTTHTHTNNTNTYKLYLINKSNSLSIYSNNYNYSNQNINNLNCKYSSYRLGVSSFSNKMIRW